MLKGKAIFELTNVDSGEKKVIKEENMITNILKTFVQQTGVFNYNIFSMQSAIPINDMKLYMAGGLMLFENTIEENPNIIYPPPNNRMIGQASDIPYTGNNLCAGSYNASESGPLENGYKFVWDFTTHQANGQIGCACLTSIEGGKIGAGCSSSPIQSDWIGSLNAFAPHQSASSYSSQYELINGVKVASKQIKGLGICLYIDFAENCTYSFEYLPAFSNWTKLDATHPLKTRKFIVNKNRLCLNNFSLFDNSKTSSPKIIDTFECSLPDNFTNKYSTFLTGLAASKSNNALPGCMNEYNKHIYMYYHLGTSPEVNKNQIIKLNPNDEFMILDLDIENKTLTAFSTVNTTGETLSLGGSTQSNHKGAQPVYVTDKYILMHMDNGCLYRISRDNNADVLLIVDPEGNTKSLGAPFSNFVGSWVDVGGKLYGLTEPFRKTTTCHCIDLEEGVIYPWSANSYDFPGLYYYSGASSTSFNESIGGGIIKSYGLPYEGIWFHCSSSNASTPDAFIRIYPFIFPHYLLTINNLEEPVYKTSAQTMKVTYIISES